MQRGLQAGITIYAPSIILTTILGWDLTITVILVGALIIFSQSSALSPFIYALF